MVNLLEILISYALIGPELLVWEGCRPPWNPPAWWGGTGDLVQLCSPSYSPGCHSIRSMFTANMLGRETVHTFLMLTAFCQHHILKDAGRWHHLQSYCFSLSWDRAVPGEHDEVTIKQVKYRTCVFDRNNLNTSTNKIKCFCWCCFVVGFCLFVCFTLLTSESMWEFQTLIFLKNMFVKALAASIVKVR